MKVSVGMVGGGSVKTLTQWLREFTSDEIDVDDPAEERVEPLTAPTGRIPEQTQREPEVSSG